MTTHPAPIRALARLTTPALDALFPPRCLHCGAHGSLLCATCLGAAAAPAPPLCQRCGRSLVTATHPIPHAAPPCDTCAAGLGPTALDALRSVAVYDGVITEAILALKFQRRPRLAEPLGDLLAAYLHRANTPLDIVLAIPLHPQRQRERGYNQADLLARRCAARLGLRYLPNALQRARATPPQIGLSRAERRANVHDAFALGLQSQTALLRGRRLLLIDDVTTSGATLDAAATILRAAQPAHILGLAVARPNL